MSTYKKKVFSLSLVIFMIVVLFGLAGCSKEEKAFKKAQAQNTIEAYEEYLKKYPKGKYLEEAKRKISELLDLFPIIKNGKMGYIDAHGRIRIEPKYDFAGRFSEGMALINLAGKWGFINKSGEEIVKPQYHEIADFSEGLAMVKSNGKVGFIDRNGKFVITPQFDDAWSFREGLALVKVKDRWGFITPDGKIAIEPSYNGAYDKSSTSLLFVSKDGKILRPKGIVLITEDGMIYTLDEKKGKIDKLGKYNTLLYEDYSGKNFVKKTYEGLVKHSLFGGGWGYQKGNTTTFGIESWVDIFSESLARIIIKGKWGYINKNGEVHIKPQFDFCSPFSNGYAVVQIDNKFGVINSTGKIVVKPLFKGIGFSFSENLIAVTSNGETWGYVDTSGQVVIKEQFDEVCPFKEGLACVKIKTKWVY